MSYCLHLSFSVYLSVCFWLQSFCLSVCFLMSVCLSVLCLSVSQFFVSLSLAVFSNSSTSWYLPQQVKIRFIVLVNTHFTNIVFFKLDFSLYLCTSVSLSSYLCIFLSFAYTNFLPRFKIHVFSFSLRLSVSFSSVSLSLCLYVSLPLCLSVCLSVSLALCLSVSLLICLSVSLLLCLSVFLSLFLSIFISLCLFLLICLDISYLDSKSKFLSFEVSCRTLTA